MTFGLQDCRRHRVPVYACRRRIRSVVTAAMLTGTTLIFFCTKGADVEAADLSFLNATRPVLDAHNCYPYENRWSDRIDRALKTGFPVGIEQDMAWYVDPASGKGRAVVSHTDKVTGAEPELRAYFFERVRPIVEKALAENDRATWPIIIVHFDFKMVPAPL